MFKILFFLHCNEVTGWEKSSQSQVLDQCILKQMKRILDDPSRMSCYHQAGGTEQSQLKWFRRHETWLASLFMLMIPTQQNKPGNSKKTKPITLVLSLLISLFIWDSVPVEKNVFQNFNLSIIAMH